MKTNHNKATPRVYHTLRQIVQRIPRWLIEKGAISNCWSFLSAADVKLGSGIAATPNVSPLGKIDD